jgi:hypothetical protein
MTGKPVFPMIMKNHMIIMTYSDVLKEFILSGVRVRPKSLNAELAVQNPHQVLEIAFPSTILPYFSL